MPLGAEVASIAPDYGGYLIAGREGQPDIKGLGQGFIAYLDTLGKIVWFKPLAGTEENVAASAIRAHNGDVIFIGSKNSDDSNTIESESHGLDFWIARADSNGKVKWERTFGNSNNDIATNIVEFQDGTLGLDASSSSPGRRVSAAANLQGDWYLHLDSAGEILTQHVFASSGQMDNPNWLTLTRDGNLLLPGNTSFKYNSSIMLKKITPDGEIIWEADTSKPDHHEFEAATELTDGTIVTISRYPPPSDFLFAVSKYTAEGRKLWSHQYPASSFNGGASLKSLRPVSIVAAKDGWFAVAVWPGLGMPGTAVVERFPNEQPGIASANSTGGIQAILNPASKTISLTVLKPHTNQLQISVYDETGRVIKRATIPSKPGVKLESSVDVAHTFASTYFVTVLDGNSVSNPDVVLVH